MILALLLAFATQDLAVNRDLAQARALFARNVQAIQERDREAYLACYLDGDRLVRTGPAGMELGFAGLAEGTPATGSDDWPVALVARDLRLTWLVDGWVYGTYRYQVDFGGEVVEGLSERLFRKTDAGWRIVVSTAFGAPEGVPAAPLALVGATLHDGSGGPPIEDAVVVTRDGRFEAVGPRATTPVPEGVEVIDVSGSFLAPGLIDTHVHYSQTGWADGRPDARDLRAAHPYEAVQAELERRPDRFHRAFLACGVTAVFDNGGFPWTRRMGEASEDSSLAPHVVAAGPLLSTMIPEPLTLPDRAQFVLMEDEESVRRAVRNHAAAGSDAIKVWYVVRQAGDVERFAPLVHAAGAAAAEVGLPLIVHATELEAARVAVAAGAHLLVHSVDDGPVDDDFVQAVLAAGTYYCPTLLVAGGYVHLYGASVPDEVEAGLEWVHPSIRARIASTRELQPSIDRENLLRIEGRMTLERRTMFANLVTLVRAGVPVVLGTDAGNPMTLHGPSIFPEAEAMQAAGLTAAEVLRAATLDAAGALGRGDDLGLVAPGRVADLIVLERDPGEDIAHLRTLTHVLRAGTLHRREFLRQREDG